ncbi:MAG: 50S ribosomal protein L10 [bacterium]
MINYLSKRFIIYHLKFIIILYEMTITKEKKQQLLAKYREDLGSATNAVIIQQKSIPVNVANKIRMEVKTTDGKMNVIKKRIFLRALKDAGLEDVNVDVLEGPVFALYAHENEFGPLKVINKYLKEFKKENKGAEFTFLGGWFEKKWQGGEYVSELANVPTKEELISKLCYLFNYPLQSFACVTSEIAKKMDG